MSEESENNPGSEDPPEHDPRDGAAVETQPSLPMELPPTAIDKWRVHTGERFERDHPEVAEFIVALYRQGTVSCTAIANEVGPLCGRHTDAERKALHSIIRGITKRRIPAIDRKAIIVAEGLETVGEGIVKARALIDSCGDSDTKQLGGVAIAVKSINEVVQLHSGGATRITGKTEDGGRSKFDQYREAAKARLAAQKAAAVDVESEAAETGRLGDTEGASEFSGNTNTNTPT